MAETLLFKPEDWPTGEFAERIWTLAGFLKTPGFPRVSCKIHRFKNTGSAVTAFFGGGGGADVNCITGGSLSYINTIIQNLKS